MLNNLMMMTFGLVLATVLGTGCKKKETVFEMKTPGGGIKVEQDKDSGAIEVEVDEDK